MAKRDTPMRIGFIFPEPMKYSLVVRSPREHHQPRKIVPAP
jgi:hypothetical protein